MWRKGERGGGALGGRVGSGEGVVQEFVRGGGGGTNGLAPSNEKAKSFSVKI